MNTLVRYERRVRSVKAWARFMVKDHNTGLFHNRPFFASSLQNAQSFQLAYGGTVALVLNDTDFSLIFR
jgi:hypothetical protein